MRHVVCVSPCLQGPHFQFILQGLSQENALCSSVRQEISLPAYFVRTWPDLAMSWLSPSFWEEHSVTWNRGACAEAQAAEQSSAPSETPLVKSSVAVNVRPRAPRPPFVVPPRPMRPAMAPPAIAMRCDLRASSGLAPSPVPPWEEALIGAGQEPTSTFRLQLRPAARVSPNRRRPEQQPQRPQRRMRRTSCRRGITLVRLNEPIEVCATSCPQRRATTSSK